MKPKKCVLCGCEMSIDDEGTQYHRGKHWAELDWTFCLKRQLENAKNRVKRLEEAGDKLTNCIACGCNDGGCRTCRETEDNWRKAKEAA